MISDRNQKYIARGLTTFAVVAAALFFLFVLEHLGPLTLFLGKIVKILMPFTYGAVMAFLITPTYQALSAFVTKYLRPGDLQGPTGVKMGKRVLVKFHGNSSTKLFTEAERLRKERNVERIEKIVAASAYIIVIPAVLTALVAMLIPQLISDVPDLMSNLPKGTNSISGWIQMLLYGENPGMEQMIPEGYRQISGSLIQQISAGFIPNLNKYLTQMTSGVMRLFVFLKNFFIGLIVMAYGLSMKEALAARSKRFLFMLLPRCVAGDTIAGLRYVEWVFSNFIADKIIDSIIIGTICYICMSFMKISYTLLINVFVDVTNVIPFFGPFVGTTPGAFILPMISPITTLQFLIFILVLQQFNGNILGPRIFGSTTGMSSFWVPFAILFFDGIWGIIGVVVGIPTFTVLTGFTERALTNVLKKKKLLVEEGCYDALDCIDMEDGSLHYGRRDKEK